MFAHLFLTSPSAEHTTCISLPHCVHHPSPTASHPPRQGRCHVALIASSSDLSSLQSACEDYVSLHKLGRSDVHVHTLILADPAASSRREDMREISRTMQQIERQEPCSVASDKDMSALFYSVLHAAITSLLQASSLDWFVASPSAPGMQPQYAPGRGADTSDGSGGGGSTTRRSEAGASDNAPSWLTMDGQVCRCRPPLFTRHCFNAGAAGSSGGSWIPQMRPCSSTRCCSV